MRTKTCLLLITMNLLAIGRTEFAVAACDPVAGQKVYNKCRACHSLEPATQLMGPSLYDVIGRRAGSVDSFNYSLAMAQADLVWDEGNLDAFLDSPQETVPGNVMPFSGLKSREQRENLLCFLRDMNTASDNTHPRD